MKLKQFVKTLLPNKVKQALANAIRPFGAPPMIIKRLLAFQGVFSVNVEKNALLLTHTNRWIETDVFWKGIKGYERESMRIWIKASKLANTIVDIGANTGLFSLVAKTVNRTAVIHGFEPLPMFRNVFTSNCSLNKYKIDISEKALSNFQGKSKFYVPQECHGNLYSSSLSMDHYLRHQKTPPVEVDVEVTTFDSFLNEKALLSIDLVKIDAEGHDYEVLEGMKYTIENYKPDFLIEIQSDEEGERIMQLLPPSSYLYFNIDESKGPRLVASLGRSDTLNYFVCKRSTAAALALR